ARRGRELAPAVRQAAPEIEARQQRPRGAERDEERDERARREAVRPRCTLDVVARPGQGEREAGGERARAAPPARLALEPEPGGLQPEQAGEQHSRDGVEEEGGEHA